MDATMSWSDRLAILLDGEYVKQVLGRQLKRFPTHADVMAEVQRILAHDTVKDLSLYRIFYYTAEPLAGKAAHPLSGETINFGASATFARNARLIDRIGWQPEGEGCGGPTTPTHRPPSRTA